MNKLIDCAGVGLEVTDELLVLAAPLKPRKTEFLIELHSFRHCADAERVGSQLIKSHWNSYSYRKALALDKRRPQAFGVPSLFHVSACLLLIHAKHIPAIPVEERGDPVVGDAMNVHRDFF